MADNPFAKYAPSVPAQSGPVYGPPPKAKNPMDTKLDSLDAEIKTLTIQEKQRTAGEETKAIERRNRAHSSAASKLTALIGKLGRTALDANDNGGWFETGYSGSFARDYLPKGTAGFDLDKDLDTLRSNFAFDALQAMREASTTGGALGAITERELALLEASVANIDPNQSHQNFLRAVEDARQAYLDKLAVVDPATAKEMGYNPQRAQKAWKRINDEYRKEFGVDAGSSKRSQSGTKRLRYNPQTGELE